ncbi:hypothetical protein [Streptomyces sp. NPDC127105]|uniref:hypothetical protein n=1 Tax=Streptomyces sp. NPDC127105 TaxID=3345359 RepID=UPI00365751C8
MTPLAAAAGCRQGGWERRRGTEELWRAAVRAPLARFLASALPVVFQAVVGYAVAVALALLATWPCARGTGRIRPCCRRTRWPWRPVRWRAI